MGFLNTDCINPDCGSENAYHDGVQYICPDCDTTWGANDIEFDDDLSDEDE